MHILCALSAKALILEVEKTEWQPWTKHKMLEVLLKQSSLYARIAVIFPSKTVQNTAKISFSLNVNTAVALLNGFAGVILIFVNLVIKDSAVETMLVNIQKTNFQNVLVLELVQ